jgi:transcriptional regulator with XRE-family HTH domain
MNGAFMLVNEDISTSAETIQEMEASLGQRLKQLRLAKGLDQLTLAARAGISDRALRNLESGLGSNLRTLLSVVRALGREEWLKTIAPVATINPLQLTRGASARQRAPRRVSKREA